jgi:hypothetical protein
MVPSLLYVLDVCFRERSRSRVASPDMILPEPGTIAESKAAKTRLPVVSSIAGNGISEVLLAKNPHYTHNGAFSRRNTNRFLEPAALRHPKPVR